MDSHPPFYLTKSTGKFLYGALFTVVLPLSLAAWAAVMRDLVRLPVPGSKAFGAAIAGIGLALAFLGWQALWAHGRGFPPTRFVSEGVFRVLPHPIYTGFSMLCAGVSITAESPSGLWLVTPVVMLGCAAFVMGYERDAIYRRFGRTIPLLPSGDPDSGPPIPLRAMTYFVVLLPWLALYLAVFALGVPRGAISTYFPFEHNLKVLAWTQPVYFSCYVVVCLVPIFARTQRDLREFEVRALLAMALVFPFNLTVPLVALPRLFPPVNFLGQILSWEWELAAPAAALPSFHVIWALIAADVFAALQPRLRWMWRVWAIAVAVSCVTTGMHSILDVIAGVLVFGLVARHKRLWAATRRNSDWRVDSWKAGHTLWLGLAAAAIGAPLAPQFGTSPWLVLGALSVASSWGHLVGGLPFLSARATPVFWSALVAMFVTRLWMLGAPLHLILGVYLILAGLGRFVEEEYPGKPCFGGLRLHQWVAIAAVLIGAVVTAVGNGGAAPGQGKLA